MHRPSPALIVATIALFVALGGTSYAVTQLPKNSVGAKQLKKSAVSSPKIKDGTIEAVDMSSAALAALKGAAGAQGPPGPSGAAGAQGPQGPSVGAAAANDASQVLTTSLASVVSLGASPSASSSGPVVVAQASRLQISASVVVYKGTSQWASQGHAFCDLRYSVAGSGRWSGTTVLSSASVSLPVTATSVASYDTVPLEGSASVVAGSYDVQVRCERGEFAVVGTASVEVRYAAIDVVAIPT